MSIIKIDGTMLTSHQGASDITDVVNTSQITEGSNLYFTDVRAVDAVESTSSLTLNSLRVDKGTSATSTQPAFANAAIQAVSTTNGVPIYSLRSTSNTSFEPAKWGTGLFEIQFDADLTGVDMDGTSQTIAFNIGDRNNYYNVAGLDSKIVDTVIDGNGDIESFNGEIEFRVNDKVNGGSNQSFPLRVASSGVVVTADSSLSLPWKTLELKADRSTTAPVNNDANDIYWSAKTPNATVSLGLIEIKTDNVTLDGNNDYTVFDNRLDYIVTSMTGGSTSFHTPVSMKKDKVEQLLTKVTRNATSTGHPFATVSLIADRSTTTPSNNQSGNDLYWEAKTATQSQPLADIEVQTRDVTVDGNDDYTDFNNRMSFYTTSMSGGSITWNLPLTIDKDVIKENTPHVFVNLTTTERNALTAESGMMIFNTTDVKLQCYDGTAWNNLH